MSLLNTSILRKKSKVSNSISTVGFLLINLFYLSLYVIVLEKRDHFAVKLFFQYKQVKVDTQLGFVHNSGCLNYHISGLEGQILML